MRKIQIAILALCLSFGFSFTAYGLETSGYLENQLQITDGDNLFDTNKLRLDFQVKESGYYMLVSVNALNGLMQGDISLQNADLSDPNVLLSLENNLLELSRAYLELYPSWGKVTLGLQNIAWGNGYLFNLPDQFNPPNPLDPKGEKQGINAISTKWNLNGTAQLEAVAVPAAKLSGTDYGVKARVNIGLFDISTFFLKRYNIPVNLSQPTIRFDRTAGVLEIKGELGDGLPGIWLQGGWFGDTNLATNSTENYFTYVTGSDYTFNVGNGLYCLAEYMRNTQIEANQVYFLTRYSPQGYLTFSLSGMRNNQADAAMYSLNSEYQLNDNIEITGMYNVYPQGSSYFTMGNGTLQNNAGFTSQIVIGVKTTF
ncbi:MAG TPA: hypothetical protein VF531_02790 [Bacillota bacterium]